jgi:hypothetical protein
MAGPQPVAENIMTVTLVIARIGIRTADSTIAASEIV